MRSTGSWRRWSCGRDGARASGCAQKPCRDARLSLNDKGHVTTRYYGWYANRPRGMRGQAEPAAAAVPPAIVPAPRLAPTEATRRWAALLQQIFEVDPLACPACHATMRIVAFITQASVIAQILTHLRARASRETHAGARSPPSTREPSAPGTTRRPTRRPAAAHRAP